MADGEAAHELHPGRPYTFRVIGGAATLPASESPLRGRFLEEVEIGRSACIGLEDGSRVLTSTVRSVFRLRTTGFWLQTANSTYLVEPCGESL